MKYQAKGAKKEEHTLKQAHWLYESTGAHYWGHRSHRKGEWPIEVPVGYISAIRKMEPMYRSAACKWVWQVDMSIEILSIEGIDKRLGDFGKESPGVFTEFTSEQKEKINWLLDARLKLSKGNK